MQRAGSVAILCLCQQSQMVYVFNHTCTSELIMHEVCFFLQNLSVSLYTNNCTVRDYLISISDSKFVVALFASNAISGYKRRFPFIAIPRFCIIATD